MTMKTTVRNTACVLFALFSTLTTNALAAPQTLINPLGSGAGGAMSASSINVGGVGFVQIIPDASGTTFQFVEHGAYQLLQADQTTPFGAHDLTVSYSVRGTGSFIDFSALRFTSGEIGLYSDPNFDFATSATHYGVDNGVNVASFSVDDGGVSTSGLVTVKAHLDAGTLLPGYLFSTDGSDLANHTNVQIELGVFNAPTAPDALLISGVVCGLSQYTGAGCDGTAFQYSPLAYTVRDGGSVTISAVPEPGVFSLLIGGLGLASFSTRKRRPSAI